MARRVQLSGRDPNTGDVTRPGHTQSWIGTIAWLCFIEQIGNAVELTTKPRFNAHAGAEGGFRSALAQFAHQVTNDQAGAWWALRNSLAHDYRLVNDRCRADLKHRFRLLSLDREPRLAWTGVSRRRRT